MVEVTIDSIRISLMSQHRVVILKDTTSDRYLPIWIGPSEADAITVELQNMEVARPLTHDLLKSVIHTLGGEVKYIVVNNLEDDIFYAKIVIDQSGRELEIDSRPSDAIALSVRVQVPIYVEEKVMDSAVTPDEDVDLTSTAPAPTADDDKLSVFKDFVDSLDMDDLEDSSN
ncbi:MAG TPA: bifunctional nuclease family protein [Aggregatilineales bacterium]|nr:bifunctional nuclease family protein [Aggregatilineales bacterium]